MKLGQYLTPVTLKIGKCQPTPFLDFGWSHASSDHVKFEWKCLQMPWRKSPPKLHAAEDTASETTLTHIALHLRGS